MKQMPPDMKHIVLTIYECSYVSQGIVRQQI